jgi:hypothetical protein
MRNELVNPRSFVRFWFYDVRKYVMSPNGHFDGNDKDIFGMLWLDYEELHTAETIQLGLRDGHGRKITYPKATEKNMEKAWLEFTNLEAKAVATKVIASLAHDSSKDDSQLRSWLTATVGDFSDFDLAVVKHSLWQVKRKLSKRKVVYHIAPCFWGKQGGGKTEAIKKLLEPLSFLSLEWGINDAVDPRNTQTLADNYICLFDEMAGLQRVEIEGLKRIISAETLNYRPLRTNAQIRVVQNCTFFGISNKSLSENIFDSTGLRRFVEFKCVDNLNWDAINSTNAIEIWQSIDESRERGYIEGFATELKQHQEALMVQDEMQHFIQDTNLAADLSNPQEVQALDLYNHYINWRALNGYSAKSPQVLTWFCVKLRSHGLNKRVKRIDGKEKTVYLISAKSEILNKEVLASTPSKLLEFKK